MSGYTIIQNSDIISNLSDGAFRLYCLLQSMCYGKDKDYCYPSQSYLGNKLHKSVRTVQRYLKELIDNKLIIKRRRGSISNIYKLVHKKILQGVDKALSNAKNTYKEYKSNYRKDERPNFNDYNQRKYNYKNLEDMFQRKLDYDSDLLYQT